MVRATLVLAVALHAQFAFGQSGDFVIQDVRIFDGVDIQPATDIRISGGLIAEIGPRIDTNGVAIVDGAGATLLPGLIDAHVHVYDVAQLRDALRFGVTTVIDMGSDGTALESRSLANSRADFADVRTAGFIATAPGGHGTEYGYELPTVMNAEAARLFVENRAADGVDHIKLAMNGYRNETQGTPTLDAATVQALCQAAHENELKVFAHVESIGDVQTALDAGVDILAHEWRGSGSNPALADTIASQGVFISPTLTVWDSALGEGQANLLSDERITPFLSNGQVQILMRESFPAPEYSNAYEIFNGLLSAEVRMIAGTDATNFGPIAATGPSLHRLLELFVIHGMTPQSALNSATGNVADALGIADRGRIQEGLRADLVLVQGDPTEDITATRAILKIWKAGTEVDRQP